MCTTIAFHTDDFYFGRNMDLEYSFGEKVIITPGNYSFLFKHEEVLSRHYAMIGMGSLIENYPMYAEAANEKGLCMAGLNFPGNAFYSQEFEEGKHHIALHELIPWILGSCATVEEACERLKETQIVATRFLEELPLATLHWHIADKERSIVAEAMKDGMHIYENPVEILTNNPPFGFHLANLNHYLNLTADFPENRFSSALELQACGVGMGAMGLPGDASSVSRFVRAAFYKLHSRLPKEEIGAVTQIFHVMDGISMVKGEALDPQKRPCYTTYTCCINATKGIYYYKTYENNQITAVTLRQEPLNGEELISFEPVKEQQIRYAAASVKLKMRQH